MAAFTGTTLLLRKTKGLICLVTPRRNRVKAKWAVSLPKHPSTNLALQNLDATCSLQLGEQWPSVRLSMLCEQKYGALVNNYSASDGVMADLQAQGCRDFVSHLRVGGAMQDRLQEAAHSSNHKSLIVNQEVAPPRLSPNIKCLVFPRGDISRFKPARPDKYGLLGYYLIDAASILPVLALDVREGHAVLDLCAAPGGKTLALLQTQAIRFLCVNDSSVSRTFRLRGVLKSYLPEELLRDESVRITSFDGRNWGEIEKNTFDRVLVDAPCTTDRHSVMEEDNNIFKRIRTKERQRLPQLQTELLLAGIQAARPGGEVLYSTCSLSQLQNQYVVEQAIQLARNEHSINVQVADLRPLTSLFKDTFHFAPDPHLGELVLPHLAANFGPIYMCKLQRMS